MIDIINKRKLSRGELVAPNCDVDGLKITHRWWFA
jgi:hypothetical protein